MVNYPGLLARLSAASKGSQALSRSCRLFVYQHGRMPTRPFLWQLWDQQRSKFFQHSEPERFSIPLLRERNPWILSSTSRKDHLWRGFAVFTKNMTEDTFHINLNTLTNLRHHYNPQLKINIWFFWHRISTSKLNLKHGIYFEEGHIQSIILFLLLLNVGQLSG